MKQLSNNRYLLSTGKEIYAFNHVLGLCPGGNNIYGGYDDEVYMEWWNEDEDQLSLTKEERIEIADYMILLWSSYKSRILNKTIAPTSKEDQTP